MAVTKLVLNRSMHGGVTNGVQWFECDTEADRPTTDVNQGDIAYSKDTDKLWKRTATPAWVEIGGGGGADVKSGTVSIQENGTANITFATAFSTTPVVVANVQDSGEYNNIQTTAVSTTGATLALEKVGGGAASTYTVGWVATDAGNA